jgi:hypothetical protein
MRSEPVDKGNELRQAQLSIYLLCDLAGGCIASLISKLLLYSLRGRGIPIDHRHNDRITFRLLTALLLLLAAAFVFEHGCFSCRQAKMGVLDWTTAAVAS